MGADNTEADDTMWCLALVSSIAVFFLSLVLQRRFALPAASSAISLFLQTADLLRKSTTKKVTSSCCAACGITEVEADDITLKECATCDLVRYCSDACQKNHWPQHEKACKKRSTELRDELLFKQPESTHIGDCPICCLHMPLDVDKSTMMTCCCKCKVIAAKLEPASDTNEQCETHMMKRVEANDPVALCQEGLNQYNEGDYLSAFEYYTTAAELGDAEAHYQLSTLYSLGHGVEKNEENEMHHLEEAAIGFHPSARFAVKHWIIAATQGDDDSIEMLLEIFQSGVISKDDLAAALRAHQAAVDATKSPQREAAEEYRRSLASVECT
eukprot:scaffold15261_cov78-Skeletonema_marinoi.AAC.4